MRKTYIMLLAPTVLALAMPASVSAEELGNDDVIALLNAGLGEEAVIAKIEASDGEYQTDTKTLLQLKDQGVPSKVIAAMVRKASEEPEMSADSPDPMTPHYSGLYLYQNAPEARMEKIDPTSSNQTKTGGILGYAITGGIASASVKAVIPGSEARYSTSAQQPVFYAFFDESNGQQSTAFATGFGGAVQSPNEISLVRLKQKKGRREARIGSVNIGGAKAGVMDKDRIAFSYDQVRRGVYKIQPDAPLEPGEYGFLYAVGGGSGPGLAGSAGGAGARVFAFSVKPAAAGS